MADDLVKKIIEKLIFDETVEHLLSECRENATPNVILRTLKHLLHHRYVVASPREPGKRPKPGFMFDSDHMEDYTYRATAKGLNLIRS